MDSQGSIWNHPDGNLFVPRRGILREDFELDARTLRLKNQGRRGRVSGRENFPAAPAVTKKRVPAPQEPTKENYHAF
jgi:hypothetical protein